MKKVNFTLFLAALIGTGLTLRAQSPEGSTGWETLQPGEPLVVDEDFQGFPFFHVDQNPDQGNSDNLDPEHPGYKNDTTFVIATGSTDTIFYNFYQCAFAPNWIAAYAYTDSVTTGTSTMTAQVTRGFVEISREYASHLTVAGYYIIDLRSLDFVEVVQYAHSSCGGNKRGFTLAKSTDDGVTWDTVRYQSGNISTSLPQPNTYNCQNSAYGMRWEDGIYDFNVMLKFTDGNGQAVRIHDLKIYGDVAHPGGIKGVRDTEIGITCINRVIRLSEKSGLGIYDLKGSLLRRADNVETYSVQDLPEGVYIIRAKTDKKITTRKISIR
jgi:hypothetical protein